MRSILCCSAAAALLGLPSPALADVYEFKLLMTKGEASCTGVLARTTDLPVAVAIAVPSEGVQDANVKLEGRIDLAEGAPVTGPLTKATGPGSAGVWRFVHDSKASKAKVVRITGTVESRKVDCEVAEGDTRTPPAGGTVSMAQRDFQAARWLDDNDLKLDAIRARIKTQNPKWPADRIVFLPHLPSGAKAPSFPFSISERDLTQVVMVVPTVEGRAVLAVDWTLTRCESIPNYRVYGDIGALAKGEARVLEDDVIHFEIVRIGQTMSCGAEALMYTLTVTSAGDPAGRAVQSTVPVRPVYHLGATAMFGFDRTMTSDFKVRDGKIDEVPDRIGPGLLLGATYFVKGVDFGDMRWYNHVVNPFVVVAPGAPADRFVVGTALTYRGGISLGVGMAFNHVDVLGGGFTAGQDFAGPGDIPLDKTWRRGFFIGIGVDDKLLSSFRKLQKSGTGGGSGQAGAANAAEKKLAAAEEAKKKPAAEDQLEKKQPVDAEANKKPESRDEEGLDE
jgi:hypothetical protein